MVEARVGVGRVDPRAKNHVLRFQDQNLLIIPVHPVDEPSSQTNQGAVIIFRQQLINPQPRRRGRGAMPQSLHERVLQRGHILTNRRKACHHHDVTRNEGIGLRGLHLQSLPLFLQEKQPGPLRRHDTFDSHGSPIIAS